jgi:GMP synthase (glutamine-hydrolysing)
VYEKGRFPYLQAEEDFVGMALRAGRPVMGICLGAQMLAQVLGAKVFRNPRGKEIGWAQVDLLPDAQQDPLFQGLPASFQAFHWHGDTFDLPLGCKPLASSALTPNQAFSWNGQAWALQFHLEVEAQDIRAWLAEYASEAQGAQDAEAGLARHYAAYREVGLKVFGRFLDLAAL